LLLRSEVASVKKEEGEGKEKGNHLKNEKKKMIFLFWKGRVTVWGTGELSLSERRREIDRDGAKHSTRGKI